MLAGWEDSKMLKCKECGFDVELDEAGNWVHKKGDNVRWHKAPIAPLWPALSELTEKYAAAATERAQASLDIARLRKKLTDAETRFNKARERCDLLTGYISEHPES
jgi:hypothetical protein